MAFGNSCINSVGIMGGFSTRSIISYSGYWAYLPNKISVFIADIVILSNTARKLKKLRQKQVKREYEKSSIIRQ